MKVTVIKKGSQTVKPGASCPYVIDMPPEAPVCRND
jgi:hypothetical protein